MNIIGNECTGGYVYKKLNIQYNNPFIWTNLTDDDFVILMNEYDNINFDNYNFSLLPENESNWVGLLPNNTSVPVIEIDEKIKLYHTHHLYSDVCGEGMTLIDNNRYVSKNIKDVVLGNYLRRVGRLKECNEKPTFLWHEWDSSYDIQNILESGKNHKKIILTYKLNTSIIDNALVININDIVDGMCNVNQEYAAEWLVNNDKINI